MGGRRCLREAPSPNPCLQPSPLYWKTSCMSKGTPENNWSTGLALLGSTFCVFTSNLQEGGEETSEAAGRRMAPGLPLPAVRVVSPPEVPPAEQQHLTAAAREGPGDFGHLRAQAQLVQMPRA